MGLSALCTAPKTKYGKDPTDTVPTVTDWADIVPEPYEDDDVDASVLEKHYTTGLAYLEPKYEVARTVNELHPPATQFVVGPLKRQVKPKMRGADVLAIKRALWRAGFYKGRAKFFTNYNGAAAVKALKKFQKWRKLTPDGVYGKETHKQLAPFYDAYTAKLYHQFNPDTRTREQKLRDQFIADCLYLYHNRGNVSYSMSGLRMTIVRKHLTRNDVFRYGRIWEDCSSSGKGLFYWLGLPDPNGFGYNNTWGFTGTMIRTGHSVAPYGEHRTADAFFTGGFPFHHVWYYLQDGVAFSHGSETGPHLRAWNYRSISHAQRYID